MTREQQHEVEQRLLTLAKESDRNGWSITRDLLQLYCAIVRGDIREINGRGSSREARKK